MALITADRFNSLKAAVKAECQRRKYTGSVEAYGGTAYDYSVAPASGKTVTEEHSEKNVVPMNAINSSAFPIPTSYENIITETDIAAMETKVAAWATREVGSDADNSASDCAASCTGLCHSCTGNCVSGCSSCTGSCTGSCTETCSGKCSGCSGCGGNCNGVCQSDCANCAYYWGG